MIPSRPQPSGHTSTRREAPAHPSLRLGLCCLFRQEPVRFRTATATVIRRHSRREQLARLSALCLANAQALEEALRTCHRLAIEAFRISSPLWPLTTHPEVGYRLDDLPDARAIRTTLRAAADFADRVDIRRSLHPDQFVLLNSPRPEVLRSSLEELEYQALLADLTGADTINLHIGGLYDDKAQALRRFTANVEALPDAIRSRLSIENDDRRYAPRDALPLADALALPVVYDVHHHRCLPDGLSEAEATERCAATWLRLGREPFFHLSSPRDGWSAANPRPHADRIDPADVPAAWRRLPYRATVDIEAKDKELAVIALRDTLHPPLD